MIDWWIKEVISLDIAHMANSCRNWITFWTHFLLTSHCCTVETIHPVMNFLLYLKQLKNKNSYRINILLKSPVVKLSLLPTRQKIVHLQARLFTGLKKHKNRACYNKEIDAQRYICPLLPVVVRILVRNYSTWVPEQLATFLPCNYLLFSNSAKKEQLYRMHCTRLLVKLASGRRI